MTVKVKPRKKLPAPKPKNNTPKIPDLTPNNIVPLEIIDRDEQINYLYIIKGAKQVDIAAQYNLAQPTVSLIISKLRNNEIMRNRLIQAWEKETCTTLRHKVSQTAESLNPDGMPDGSKPQALGIMIDKINTIEGKVIPNVTIYVDMSRKGDDIQRELRDINRQLGEDVPD